jgi:hypothetical protein
MTNEERAVIDAARALISSDPYNITSNERSAMNLHDAVSALDAATAPGRKFMITYTWTDGTGSGNGNIFATHGGPIGEQTVYAWQTAIARRHQCNNVVVHSWQELEA